MRYIEVEIGSDDWKRIRRGSVGASETAAILGIDPYTTAYELWEQKIKGTEKKKNSAMQRGNDREEEARIFASEFLKIDFKPVMIRSEPFEWKTASLDGWNEEKQAALEIKWCNMEVHEKHKKGIIVPHYMCQLQTIMKRTEIHQMYFMTCVDGKEGKDVYISIVERDKCLVDRITIEEEIFYYHNMIKKIPPEFSDRDHAPIPDEDEFRTDLLCDLSKELKRKIKFLQEEHEEVMKQIKEVTKGRSSKTKNYKITKSMTPGRVQYDKITELEGIDLDQYRGSPIESWRLTENA